jgi:hypothetical protein
MVILATMTDNDEDMPGEPDPERRIEKSTSV